MLIYDDSPREYANLRFATQIDVAPTIVDRLGLTVPVCWQGASLLQPAVSKLTVHQTTLDSPCYALVSREQDRLLKYMYCVVGRREELYDLVADPGERVNLRETADPAVLAQLRQALERVRFD
jgi:arylsulfatase A-like enzyme